jgi:hypothetical protein
MNGPSDENIAPRKAQANQPPEDGGVDHEASQDSHRDRQAENRRRWVEANRDRLRDLNRRWRAEHLERAREINRDSMRRAAVRKRREVEVRARGRERTKRWREAHPEQVREYQRQWVEANRDKVREYSNRYYAKHRDEVNARAAAKRDADPERAKQAHKQWAERNKERLAELQRNRRADPETYQAELAANAAARRLKRALTRAGLPPKRLHPATAAERRANESEADAYFTDPARPEQVRQFTVFAESLTEHMLKHGTRMREFAMAYASTRARFGLPRVPVEDIVYARAVELVTERMRRVALLTSLDVAAAVRATKAVVRREERQQQFDLLVRTVVAQVHRNGARYAVDAEMENRARTHKGIPRAPIGSLVVQLAMQEAIERMPTSRLTIEDARSAARVAKLRVEMAVSSCLDSVDDRIQRRPAR